MATITLGVPAGTPNGAHVNTEHGKYVVAGGTVTVDVRQARALLRAGFTNANCPDMSNLSRQQSITLNAPYATGVVQDNGVSYPVSGGTVTVPRTAIPALLEAGFRV